MCNEPLWIELFQLGEKKIPALAFTTVLEPDQVGLSGSPRETCHFIDEILSGLHLGLAGLPLPAQENGSTVRVVG